LNSCQRVTEEIVLYKQIDIQGYEVTMRSVLQRHGNVEHVLGPELVTDIRGNCRQHRG
jgi:hypothetical protein